MKSPKQSADNPQLPQEPYISPAEQRQRDRKRRQREMFFAALAFFVVLVLTTIQLDQFRAGDALFVVMFNVNFVLLVGILLVVLRNGFKLLLERRRRVLGSRLRTRLVLSFVGLSLLPCLLMFLVTTKYVQLSMDFWFRDQVENSMDSALELASNIYERVGANLISHARNIRDEAKEDAASFDDPKVDELLQQKYDDYSMSLAGIYHSDGTRSSWHGDRDADRAWESAKHNVNWDEVNRQGFAYILEVGREQDHLFAVLSLDGDQKAYITLAFGMGEDFKAKLDRIVRGSKEYRNLRNIKKPLKLMLYSSLGVLTALIILGAVWFGFRLARELSAPIFALAQGTDRISNGDLSVRLNDSSKDEFGMLIRSFNKMAQDLELSRHETTGAYSLLETQNKQIARHSKYIETVLNNIAAGVISFDDGGFINTVNRAACDILGLEQENLVGKKLDDVMPELYNSMSRSLKERFHKRLESRSQHNISLTIDAEERQLLINVVGFSTDGVYRGAVAVLEDISELERMQRMAAWREVARRIAHEIKNPLTPIKLSAQRLARKFGGQVNDPAFTQSTELIVRQVEHLQGMVQEFSAFAKLPEVEPHPGDLPPLLETITELFRNSHSQIDWQLCIAEDLPRISMDRDALQRAFMNIYTNAAEALEAAGTKNPLVRVSATCIASLNLVRIDVEDNGPGLSEEERSRLFEPYFSRKKGGTGLGMTIVRSIIADHRGYIRAISAGGSGTTISMELPLA